MKNSLSLLALTFLAAVACNRTAEPEVLPGKLTVEPIITKATEVNFETGDMIGLTVIADGAAENYATNECDRQMEYRTASRFRAEIMLRYSFLNGLYLEADLVSTEAFRLKYLEDPHRFAAALKFGYDF